MADKRLAAAERQRRYRKHSAGDHTLCLPARCEHAGDAPLPVTPRKPRAVRPGPAEHAPKPWTTPTDHLGTRGTRLWDAMADQMPSEAHKVLLEEACRAADRLDRLDAMLAGRQADWLRIVGEMDSPTVRLAIDSALSETRQQAAVLKALVAELRQATATGKHGSGSAKPPAKGGGLADLTARIADRQRRTTG